LKKPSDHNTGSAIGYFSEIAGAFSGNYTGFRQFIERREVFVKETKNLVPAAGNVLDLGCGPGLISRALAEIGYKVTGIDGSSEMLAIARSNTDGKDNPYFLLKNIPFPAGDLSLNFDAVVSSSLVEYLEQYRETVQMVREVLKKGGVFIVSIPNMISLYRRIESLSFLLTGKPGYLRFVKYKPTPSAFIDLLNESGFEFLGREYFASKTFIGRITGIFVKKKYICNMIICSFRKV
jgi:SAM-dependent methyltransferase